VKLIHFKVKSNSGLTYPDQVLAIDSSWVQMKDEATKKYWPILWFYRADGLRAGVSVEVHDGKPWIHLSCSYTDHIPSYEELKSAKEGIIGRERKAIMVLPKAEENVDIHPHCLHLFCCLGDDGLPDFRGEGGTL